MRDNKWTNKKGIVLTIIGLVVISIISMVFILNENGKESASIAIIGGADGPTAIFVSSSVSLEAVAITVCGLILVVGMGIFIYKKIKNSLQGTFKVKGIEPLKSPRGEVSLTNLLLAVSVFQLFYYSSKQDIIIYSQYS